MITQYLDAHLRKIRKVEVGTAQYSNAYSINKGGQDRNYHYPDARLRLAQGAEISLLQSVDFCHPLLRPTCPTIPTWRKMPI